MIARLLAVLAMVLLSGLALASPAMADDNRPLTVAITGEGGNGFRVQWKMPPNLEAALLPALSAGDACQVEGSPRAWSDALGHWHEELWRCPRGIVGQTVTIEWPRANPGLATIVRFRPTGADDPQTILRQPQDTRFTIAAAGAEHDSFLDFLLLGVKHIWEGVDHLLFVAGLIFVAGTPRRVLATVTGFTLAHSLTLALAAFGLVSLPVPVIEAVIALSIVFLAVELVKGPRDTLTWRRPIVVASTFGLLHGFGFAVVLGEIGLPRQGLLAALLGFNLGIELGQIVFSALVMTVLYGLRRLQLPLPWQFSMQKTVGYLVGTLASFWMFQRLIG